MGRIRSLLERVTIDQAQRAHNCQASTRHRIVAGDLRLNVRNGRSWDRYCVACARAILRQDEGKIREALSAVEAGGSLQQAPQRPLSPSLGRCDLPLGV